MPIRLSTSFDELEEKARTTVHAVHDDPDGRIALRKAFYKHYGYAYIPDSYGLGNSEIAFLGWEAERGVLNPVTAEGRSSPEEQAVAELERQLREVVGSHWWRKVNSRLLLDSELAGLIYPAISPDGPYLLPDDLGPSVWHWLKYIDNPNGLSWYRSHNSSIVVGYIDAIEKADLESEYEQVFMNEVLTRLLYAQAMVEGMDFAFGKLGQWLSDPRGFAVGFIVLFRDFYPRSYQLDPHDINAVMHRNHHLMGELATFLDRWLIHPFLRKIYSLSAKWLDTPGLERFFIDNNSMYPKTVGNLLRTTMPVREPSSESVPVPQS
ncbi:MAG: hypothetical protein Q8922_14190 [Bacteroidota bacterium]|nr:hypothetical protein [Bacteroidota bacterium]MDP4233249.1 hypothetical protein [Bacteroidota bacterium]MDP4242131.1 hypothetical protein [Bacteroidota bacterium]MDP4289070.1 hypothetical protein [Bacteroidota bacterium]